MALPAIIGAIGAAAGNQAGTIIGVIIGQTLAAGLAPISGAITRTAFRAWPNQILDPASAVAVRRRQLSETFDYNDEVKAQGFDLDRRDLIYKLSQQLLNLSELITLFRRGEIKKKDLLYVEAEKIGWSEPDVDYMLKITEVIPSAGDIIRYAVREVYSPKIAEAFGQYDELPKVLEEAEDDLAAAALPVATFTKEWAAHWLLPSILQGFEMMHRGVIPFKSTAAQPLSLERLMIALDIMPAWRKPLQAISYSPYTRVDVRRMHKALVLDDEAVFTAYADVGFSPFAPGEMHITVAEAFACETCRHDSKCGRMLDFTIEYNKDPADEEKNEKDKERDRTKSDILSGLADGLLEEKEANTLLTGLGYDTEEVEYYLSRVEFERDSDELTTSLRYLHDSYIKGVITFAGVTDELGKLDLPAKMTEHYLKVWDLERIARSNKPTKAELMTFLRKNIIDETVWHAEMVGLGYPDRYIAWYKATVEEVTEGG